MTVIQTAVLDLISFTLQELRRINPNLDSYEELTVENALARSFQKLLQRELDPVWHQLSSKSRQLVSDLKTLRSVMTHLTQYDCVTFHTFVSALRTTENAVRSGGWMLMDAAETLFLTAKERVFGEEKGRKKAKLDEGTQLLKELKFEGNPKWGALLSVVDEVKAEVEGCQSLISEKILVLTADERTSLQLLELLERGEETVMARLYNKCLGEKHGRIPDDTSGLMSRDAAQKGKEPKHKGQGKKSKPMTLTQMTDGDKPEAFTSKLRPLESPVVMVYSMQHGDFEISRLINDVKPRFVVMYDADVATVRILEVFQARNPEIRLKVYFLMFDKSVEEQAYLTTLRKEKEAFEHLMEEKATMVVPEERDRADNPDLVRGSDKASDAILGATNEVTRKGGGNKNSLYHTRHTFLTKNIIEICNRRC